MRVTQDSRYGDSMEQVLYNTVAGAKPLHPDGVSFYYSDYNNDQAAKKVYYKDKWPCCSGTFPQLSRGLRDQLVLRGEGRPLCESFPAFARDLETERHGLHFDAANQLSQGEYDATGTGDGAARNFYDVSARTGVGGRRRREFP